MSDSENRPGGGLSDDAKAMMAFQSGKKSTGICYLLWFFLGLFGGHRFYLGFTGSAIGILIIYVLSVIIQFTGGVGIIAYGVIGLILIIDAFLIPGFVRDHNQALMRRIEAELGT